MADFVRNRTRLLQNPVQMFVFPIGLNKPLKYPRFDLVNPRGFSFFIYRAQKGRSTDNVLREWHLELPKASLASLINQSCRLFLLNKQLLTCKSCIGTITFTNTKLHKDWFTFFQILTGQKTWLDWAKISLASYCVQPLSKKYFEPCM